MSASLSASGTVAATGTSSRSPSHGGRTRSATVTGMPVVSPPATLRVTPSHAQPASEAGSPSLVKLEGTASGPAVHLSRSVRLQTAHMPVYPCVDTSHTSNMTELALYGLYMGTGS